MFEAVAVLACCCGVLLLQVSCGQVGPIEATSEASQSLQLSDESPSLVDAAPFSVRCAIPLHSYVYPGLTDAAAYIVLEIPKSFLIDSPAAAIRTSLRVSSGATESTIYQSESSADIQQLLNPGQDTVEVPIVLHWSGLDSAGTPVLPDQLFNLTVSASIDSPNNAPTVSSLVFEDLASVQVESRDSSEYNNRSYLLDQLARENQVHQFCTNATALNSSPYSQSVLPISALPVAVDQSGRVIKLGGPHTRLTFSAASPGLTSEESASGFLDEYRDIFGIQDAEAELRLTTITPIPDGSVVEYIQASPQGYKVFDHGISVVVSGDGTIKRVYPNVAYFDHRVDLTLRAVA